MRTNDIEDYLEWYYEDSHVRKLNPEINVYNYYGKIVTSYSSEKQTIKDCFLVSTIVLRELFRRVNKGDYKYVLEKRLNEIYKKLES